MHGFSPVESDHLKPHQHQHQHQPFNRAHEFGKNVQPHTKAAPFGEIRRSSAKGLSTADNIAISDVSSNEQMLYFTNENGNDNVKGNYAISKKQTNVKETDR